MTEAEVELPADLLLGCIEIGGLLRCEPTRMEFCPEAGEPIEVEFSDIAIVRLGGRNKADANRIDLTLLDGRKVTLLVLGRDRLASIILADRGWEPGGWEPEKVKLGEEEFGIREFGTREFGPQQFGPREFGGEEHRTGASGV